VVHRFPIHNLSSFKQSTLFEVALFVAFINGVPGGKVKEKRTREEEEKEMLNFYCAVN